MDTQRCPMLNAPLRVRYILLTAALCIGPAAAQSPGWEAAFFARPGIGSGLVASPQRVLFPATPMGMTQTATVVLTNRGPRAVVGSVRALSPPFTVLSGGGSFLLRSGWSKMVEVQFAPVQQGRFGASLAILDGERRIVALVTLLGSGGPAAPPNQNSGVRGVAMAGPITPVERPGQPNSRPLPNAVITVQPGGGGPEITRQTADQNGQFSIPLPPGTYLLVPLAPDPTKPLPRGKPQTVAVQAGKFTDVTVEYDTGIR